MVHRHFSGTTSEQKKGQACQHTAVWLHIVWFPVQNLTEPRTSILCLEAGPMWRLLFCSANCRFGTVLLLAGVLNGCFWDASSGNSGNRAVTEADTTPPVVESDTTPPAVRATNPVDGSEGVTRTGAITAEFDEDVFAQSVDEDSFTITRSVDSSGHSGTVTFDANSNTASFSPNTPLSMLKT
ncbi:unnamed protein product, partial [Laminaria digitata]